LPKGFGDKPAEAAKPAETPAKPKGTLPKGFGDKPAEAAKPKEAPKPKPSETKAQPPVTVQEALENAYYTAPMTSFADYKAKVTGYSPAPHRYWVRKTAPVGKVPTTSWHDKKGIITGYTAPSDQYFATRARMAYHPADKTFGSFSGNYLTVEGAVTQTQQQQQAPPPAEAPKPKGTLPKGMDQTQKDPPAQQSTYAESDAKSKAEKLKEYEDEYLQRIQQQGIDDEKAYQELLEAEVKSRAQKTRGSLPKGFEPKSEPEPTKPSRGTLPKGF
jgi:hypothetical protein